MTKYHSGHVSLKLALRLIPMRECINSGLYVELTAIIIAIATEYKSILLYA